MASPFHAFRKYQKSFLVVAGVILMFVFVIGDPLMSYLGGGARGGAGRQGPQAPNATAVSWNGGSLTNAEIDQMVFRRRLVNSFLKAIEVGGAQAAIEAGVEPREIRVNRMLGAETPQEGVEADVVRTKLFADLARQAGMRVGDATIVQYLDELGRQHVTREDMRNVIQRMQVGNQRMTIEMMFDAIREEMLASNFLAGYKFGLLTVTPEELWNDWRRVNDRVVIEAVPIPAEKFIVDVPEPTEAELVAFVEGTDEAGNKYNYLEREPQPDLVGNMELPSRHPGFAIPRKIDVQYLVANYDQFLTKVEGEITDAEIEKFYNDNKDTRFIKLDTGLFENAPPQGTAEESEASGADEAATATDAEGAGEAGATDAEGAGTTDAEGNDTTEEPAPAATDEAQPPAAADETQPPADGTTTEPAPAEGDQSSRGRTAGESPFRLTAFLQEEKAAEGTTEEAAASDSAATPSPPATEAPAAEAALSAETAPATETATEPAATADAPATATPAAEATTPATEDKPKEYQPLDEVRDEIRRELAGRRVTEQLIDLFTQLKSQLNSEFTKYFAGTVGTRAEGQELPPPPPELADLAKLAEQHGLSHGKTGLKSFLEIRDDTPIGKLVDLERSNERMTVPLLATLFSQDAELYQPFAAYDVDANRFLVQKIAETPRRVPTLAEVKEDVIRAWKKQKAFDVAQKNAEDLAKRIQDSGSTLVDFFANDPAEKDKVIRTDPFSWWTGGEVSRLTGQQQPLRLGEPDGVVAAGPDFMKSVFNLDDGQVAAAPNHDHSLVYVVRLDSHSMPEDALRTAYLAEANAWPGMGAFLRDRVGVATSKLVDDVERDADVKWERPKDNESQREEADEPADE
jgi:hypothetical protein